MPMPNHLTTNVDYVSNAVAAFCVFDEALREIYCPKSFTWDITIFVSVWHWCGKEKRTQMFEF